MNYLETIKNKVVKSPNIFRFGSLEDGGYEIHPEQITKASILFSGGISSNVEFEYDVFRMNRDIHIVMVDPAVSGTKLLAKGIGRFFLKKNDKLRYLMNALTFVYLKDAQRVCHVSQWINQTNGIFSILDGLNLKSEHTNILLKLDIEGSEYHILDEVISNLSKFNAMIFEFHDLHLKYQKLLDFIEISQSQFHMTFLNVNPSGGQKNGLPKVIELTFERNTL